MSTPHISVAAPSARPLRLIVAAILGVVIAAGLGIAVASWLSTDASNNAVAVGDTLPTGATPTASVTGNSTTVTVSFAETSTIGGLTLTAYDITRYPAAGGSGTSVSASCSGSPTVTCLVASEPDGDWEYTNTPTIAGSSWLGTESALSNSITVDTTMPTVTDVTSTTADGSYKAGVAIPIQVVFSEPVTVTGTPQLVLSTGSPSTTTISYAAGSGSNTLTFSYTVAAGNTSADLNYSSTSGLSLNGGTIKDAVLNDATLTLPGLAAAGSLATNKDLVIDTTAPTVTGVSSTTANGSYKAGVVIPVTVTFSEPVDVTGTPTLTLSTGTPSTTAVSYSSGSGTSTLTFTYTVAAGNTSADLNYAATSSLALAGGTIRDAATNNATLTLPALAAAGSLATSKDLVIDSTPPTVSSVTSTTANGSYKAGVVIPITVTFSEVVTVTGTPQLTLETGATDAVVEYSSGSGTNTLTFSYTVAAGNTSSDLNYVSTSALALNGGTIADAATNNATLTLPNLPSSNSLGGSKSIVIDTTAPTVTGLTSSTANGSYKAGVVIPVRVSFTENVTVTGTPQLTLETGATDAVVDYSSGSGSSTLTFSYTVGAGQTSADLDYISTIALAFNGGTVRDAATNDATVTLPVPGASGSLGNSKNIVIDTTAPTVTNVTSTAGNGTYKAGDAIPVTVTFSEVVTVGGTPRLTLETGASDAVVNYSSGSGTSTLTFSYTVAAGHSSADLDYASTTALALNGGSVRDAATNDATLTLAAPGAAGSLGANNDVVVDGVAPTVTNVTSTAANGTYNVGDVIPVTVTFSEAVTVTGTPRLGLSTDTPSTTNVNYTSGTTTNTLTFGYTVAAGNQSSDLDYAGTGSLGLNGGTIQDAAGNNATLTLPSPGAAGSLGANKAIVVDGVAPTGSDVQAPGNGNETPDSGDTIALTYSEIMDAGSIKSGWDGTSTAISVNFNHAGGSDTATFTGANLGTVTLDDTGYVTSGNNYTLSATMVMATVSGKSRVTITLTSSSGNAHLASSSKPDLSWTPSASATDLAGNAVTTSSAAESGNDDDF